MWPRALAAALTLFAPPLVGCGGATQDPAARRPAALAEAAPPTVRLEMASLAVLSLDLPGCDAVRAPLAGEEVTMLGHPASEELVVVHSLREREPLCVDTHEAALAHLGPRWGAPRGLGPKGGPRVNPERFVGLQGRTADRPAGPEDEPVPPIHGDRADDPVPPIHGHGADDSGGGLRPGSGGHPSDGDRAVAVRVTSLAL